MLVITHINSSIMKKSYLTSMLALVCCTVSAQDIILKKNADEIQAKVLKVTETEIEYKKWENLDGPIYTIPANEIFIIKYQNGSKDIISANSARTRSDIAGNFPKYQGEIAAAYGLGVGRVSEFINTDRILFETVHGIRINPYLFTGLGLGFDYFYESIDMEDYYGNAIGSYDGAGVLSSFINLKGYYPATKKLAVYFSLDLGAAFGVAGWAEGTEFHTSVGPGINWGHGKGSPRGDFSIRFQHMGTGTNAILFRIGFGF